MRDSDPFGVHDNADIALGAEHLPDRTLRAANDISRILLGMVFEELGKWNFAHAHILALLIIRLSIAALIFS